MAGASVGNLAIQISGNAGPLLKELKYTQSAVNNFGTVMNRNVTVNIKNAVAGSGSLFGDMGKLVPLAAGLGAGALVARESFDGLRQAMEFEDALASFKVLTGSMEEGKTLLDSITKLAIETPFQSPELIAAAKQLKAFGVETNQLIPTLRAIGDVSSGTGTELDRIVLAFGQVRTAGRLMGTEMRQFTEAGIPIIENLAAVMGKPVQSIRGMVEEGQVGFPHVVEAFNRMTGAGGIFFGMMDERSRTASGRWNALRENIDVAKRNVGLAFINGFGLTEMLNEMGTATEGLQKNAIRLEPIFSRMRDGFDVARAAGVAVGRVLSNDIGQGIEALTGMNVRWEEFENVGVAAVEATIIAMGRLIEEIRRAGVEMADQFLIPAGRSLQAIHPDSPTNAMQPAQVAPERSLANKLVAYSPGGMFWRAMWDASLKEEVKRQAPEVVPREVLNSMRSGGGMLVELGDAIKKAGVPTRQLTGWLAPLGEMSQSARMLATFRQEMERMRQSKLNSRLPNPAQGVSGLLGGLGDAAKIAGQMREAMRVPEQISAASMELADKVKKEMIGGTDSLSHFHRQVGLLQEGLTGGSFLGPLFGKSVLNPDQAKFGLLAEFNKLKKSIGDGKDELPHAAFKGTSEAQDVINRAMTKQTSLEEEILAVLRRAELIQEQTRDFEKKQADFLEKLLKKGGIGSGKI